MIGIGSGRAGGASAVVVVLGVLLAGCVIDRPHARTQAVERLALGTPLHAEWVLMDGARVRQAPVETATPIGALGLGEPVYVYESAEHFKRVESHAHGLYGNRLRGWLARGASTRDRAELHKRLGYQLVDYAPQGSRLTPVLPEGSAVIRHEWVDTVALNLRTGPGRDYPVLAKLERLDLVAVVDEESGWEYIRVSSGGRRLQGWVFGDLTAASPDRSLHQGRAVYLLRLQALAPAGVEVHAAADTLTVRLPETLDRDRGDAFHASFAWDATWAFGFSEVELTDGATARRWRRP